MRKAGILLPISALPSPWGIGSLGAAALEFLDFLAAAGQSCWQILPVGPTGYGDSPYQSFSSFAGNPYFIDLDTLAGQGLLEREEYAPLHWGDDPGRVDYAAVYQNRFPVLERACRRLREREREAVEAFCAREADWLEDYALFMALKDRFGGRPWQEWPRPLRLRQAGALAAAREELEERVWFWKGTQYLFFQQWRALKEQAGARGISIIGDLPIYVAGDSADVWAHPEQFQLDAEGRPTRVAGVPPDGFTAGGQLWGNPLFDWERMAAQGYAWWLKRIEFQFRLYDVLRIDHFRGFESYYAVPYGDVDARRGRWEPGPGIAFFQAVRQALGRRAIIAEDLGYLTPQVRRMLRQTGFPGMKVLQFAFSDPEGGSDYLPHRYPRNCVVYAGTHDNDTIQGWLRAAPPRERAFARAYLRLSGREGYHWGVMRAAWASAAGLAVMQAQDLLGLGSQARMNTPSTLGGNWQWRLTEGALYPALARRLRREMAVYQRLPRSAGKERA